MDMEEELVDELVICVTTEEVIEKPNVVVAERLLLVSELNEAPVGENIDCK